MDSEQVITNEKVEEGEKVVDENQPQTDDQTTNTENTTEPNPTTENQTVTEGTEQPEINKDTENDQTEQEKPVAEDSKATENEKTEETQQVTTEEKVEEGTQTAGQEKVTDDNVDEATQTAEEDKPKEEEKVDEGTQTTENEKGTETEAENKDQEKVAETGEAGEGEQATNLEKAAEEEKLEENDPAAPYAKVIAEAKKLYDEILPIEQWEFYGEKNGIKSYTRTDQATGIKMVRGEGTINKAASKFWEVVIDPARIKNWENNLCSYKKIDQIGDYEIYRGLDQKRMFVTQRETLYATKVYKQEDGTILVIQRSCDHPSVPEVKDFVRACVNLFVWQFVPNKEDENITQATCMLFIDIKGWVPTALFNTFVSDQAQNVLKLKNYVEKAF